MPRGYGQFCPVAMACEIFAERWTPLIVRELCAGRSQFNDIHKGVPLMSRTLLAQRLRDLVEAGVVTAEAKPEGRGQSYRLSAAGLAFCPIIDLLGDWGSQFARGRIDRASCDPAFLMWSLRSYVDRRLLPDRRLVVSFAFRGLDPGFPAQDRYWLVAVDGDVDLCWADPGFESDVDIRADVTRFAQVWLGHEGLAAARRDGSIEVEGPRETTALVKRLLDLHDTPLPKVFHFVPPEAERQTRFAGA